MNNDKMIPKILNEREAFSQRLRQSLNNANCPNNSPTKLMHNFNMRFPGRSITVHAARKWLVAEAIPTQDKIHTLAEWLLVSANWLRFGDNDEYIAKQATIVKSEDLKLLADLQSLKDCDRQIVREFVHIMMHKQLK
ncbi:MAG: hypothetical protein AABX84_02905 [Nanoarchaeota archaeon]